MAADKASSNQTAKGDVSKDQSAISEDITRIVGYLNTKRSNASELSSGLAQEISHRREDFANQTKRRAGQERQPSAAKKDKPSSHLRSNPALAERYHAFCHDLDTMLDGFRARVDGDKPIKH